MEPTRRSGSRCRVCRGWNVYDPTTSGPLTGDAIGAHAQGLWAAFPDLSFDLVSVAQHDSGLVALEWVMKGSNTGSMMGFPPTGLPVTLPGAAFIRVEGDKIRSAQGYFDSAAVARGLGLDVVLQPKASWRRTPGRPWFWRTKPNRVFIPALLTTPNGVQKRCSRQAERLFCRLFFRLGLLAGYPVLPIQRSILSRPHPLRAPCCRHTQTGM
jgi:predicted ester cyclase